MIACENPDCSIEWFHFGCVGLTAEVSGKFTKIEGSPKIMDYITVSSL